VPRGAGRLLAGGDVPGDRDALRDQGRRAASDGPAATRIEGDDTPNWAIVQLGEMWDEDGVPVTAVQSGFTKGSRSLVVADASSFAVGDLVNLDQANDGDLVGAPGTETNCPWAAARTAAG